MLFNPVRVRQLALGAVLLASATSAASAQHATHPVATARRHGTEPSATHGMLLVGTEQVYASHLPMFHRPHDYQVWLELELDSAGRAAFRRSHAEFPQEAVYTLEPEKFVLPAMLAHPRPFRASLYRGHFERGGKAIAENVVVRIRKVLYCQQLDPNKVVAGPPAYLLLGNAQEQFLAHRIGARPDYDQVLRVTVPPGPLMSQLATQRILEWQAAAGTSAPLQVPAAVPGQTTPALRVEQNIYLEFNDLQ